MEGINFDVGLNTGNFNSQIDNMAGSLGKVESVAKGITSALLAIGATAVTAALSNATQAFTDWEKSFANVETMMEDVPGISKEWQSSLADVGKEYGKLSEELNEAAYTFLSATGGKGTTQQFEQFVRASVAGYTDINTAVEVGLAANNAFNISMEDLSWTLDTLNRVVQKGQTDWTKLNRAVQKSAPHASAAGMSFAELGAVFATFSGKTGETSHVATELNSVLRGLTSPTEFMKEKLVEVIKPMVEAGTVTGKLAEEFQTLWDAGAGASDELGMVATGLVSTAIEAEGFANFVTQIIETADGNQGILNKMFGREEALLLLNAWVKNLDEFSSAQSAVENSTGSLDESFKKHEETLAFFYDKMAATSEKMKESLGGLLAEVGQPVFEKLGEGMEKWTERLQKATEDFATWKENLAKSEGFGSDLTKSLLGVAPLTVPVMFAVAASQKGIGQMMKAGIPNMGGLLKGAGTAAMSLGIALTIDEVKKGGDLAEIAGINAIAGALGLAAGAVGGAAAGQIVYGITVAITKVILDKSAKESLEDLRKEIMSTTDLIFEPSDKTKSDYVEQYRDIAKALQQVTAEKDWEILLTTNEKKIVEDVTNYKDVLRRELKKDFPDMNLNLLKEEFSKINPLLDQLTNRTTTLNDEFKYMREQALRSATDPLAFLKEQLEATYSQEFLDPEIYSTQIRNTTLSAIAAMEMAVKQGVPDLKATLDTIMETTWESLNTVDQLKGDQNYIDTIAKVLEEAYANAMQASQEAIKEPIESEQEIKIKINTESVAEQLQTAINSTTFEQVYDIDDFVEQIQSLDLKSTIGLDAEDSEVKAAIKALDMMPVTLLFKPDTSTITKFVNQLKFEMNVGVGAESVGDEKASGGYTANVGRTTPAGVVHGGEWVAPAWMVEDSKFSRAIESLEESRRTRGYADGGTVIPQSNQQTFVFNFNGQLIQDDPESKRKIAEWVHESFREAGAIA